MKRTGTLLAGLLCVLSAFEVSQACAPIGRPGEEIRISDESAIIVWNAPARVQHFIRRASINAKSADIGFLVPTPTVPELAEANNAAFGVVEKLSEPDNYEKYMRTRIVPGPASAPRVTVVATAKVGGYDAAVLDATDATALDAWLKANGYASNPALLEWYKPYVEKRWMITAFKLANDSPQSSSIDAKAVRMSFRTEQPIYPYREPESAGDREGRSLNVYFLGDARVEAKAGVARWEARSWSKTLTPGQSKELREVLKLAEAQTGQMKRLTVFLDYSKSRAGKGDLTFEPATNQADLPHPEQPEIDKILKIEDARSAEQLLWGSLLLTLLGLAYYIHWRRKSRKKPAGGLI